MDTSGCDNVSCQVNQRQILLCSRCKAQRYCCKSCQRAAWPSHRSSCHRMATAKKWRELELEFWTNLPEATIEAMDAEGLNPSSMAFYGEIYFGLCGLKSCVILTGIYEELRGRFIEEVIHPTGIIEAFQVRLTTVGMVTTPAFEFYGHIALIFQGHPLAAEANHILMTSVPKEMSETIFSRLLDYPISLEDCTDSMLEIGYIDCATNQLVTSFCAMDTLEHRQAINLHYSHYTTVLGSMLTLRMSATRV